MVWTLKKRGYKMKRGYNVPAARKWATRTLHRMMVAGEIHSFWVSGKDEWHVKYEASDDWEMWTWEEMKAWLQTDMEGYIK